jgi:hypothetical protein
MVNYHSKKLLFLRFKYRSNLLSYQSNLLSFQGKYNVIKITIVIYSKMAVNYLAQYLFYNIGLSNVTINGALSPTRWHYRPQV